MTAKAREAFSPDYSVHPGEILGETLQARSISQAEFASRCGLSEKHVSQIINGKASISSETALAFERVLGMRASLWMNLESSHRLFVARRQEGKRIASYVEWAREFPLRELAKRGWIPPGASSEEKARALLGFFGVASPDAWEAQYGRLVVAYRKSPTLKTSPKAVAAWLRIGDLLASEIETDPFDRSAFRSALEGIRSLTDLKASVFEPRMKQLCAESGVALVFLAELPKTRLSGATRWVSPDKAVILQSLRHRKDDHFWFTFFHEAAHVLLHGKREIFIDDEDAAQSAKEDEADRFAANLLIPEVEYRELSSESVVSRAKVRAFAKKLGIAPGIVVGRLQHDQVIPFDWLNDLKRTFAFSEKRSPGV
jgi:addiction module HigA family antidote